MGGVAALRFLGGDRLFLPQLLRAFGLAARQGLFRASQLQLGTGAFQRDVERSRINAEERLAGADDVAFAEQDGFDVTGDAGADLDALRGLDPPHLGELRLHETLLDGCDVDQGQGGGRRCRLRGGRANGGLAGDDGGRGDQRKGHRDGTLGVRGAAGACRGHGGLRCVWKAAMVCIATVSRSMRTMEESFLALRLTLPSRQG